MYEELFPARAGVILPSISALSRHRALPRTRGGDPTAVRSHLWVVLSSPHARG